MALLKDEDAGDNWIVDREGQSVVLQAQPVKAMRSRKTRNGPGHCIYLNLVELL